MHLVLDDFIFLNQQKIGKDYQITVTAEYNTQQKDQYYSVSTQLCVAATLLLLPGAGTNDSDRPLGLIVVTR